MIHRLIIDNWHPAWKNQWLGAHWRVRWKLGKTQADILAVEARIHGVPKAAGKRAVILQVYGWPGKRKLPDKDAPTALFLDGLRDSGLITDDDEKGLASFTVEYHRDKHKKTVITLEDC